VNWSRAHWLVGLLTLLIFPLTGAYMLHVAVVPNLDTVSRLIFRSRHLFLLLVAVANLALSNSQPIRLVQRVAATLILVSPFLLIAAFFIDPTNGLKSSKVFHFAMYGLFAAGVLLAIANRPRRGTPSSRMLD
jgi:peptidoglycan/LPS O-acetylase OafA/YrhL